MYQVLKDEENPSGTMPYEPLSQDAIIEETQLKQLQENQRTFMGFKRTNSSLYNNVITNLEALTKGFNQPIYAPGIEDIEKIHAISHALENIKILYQNLISSCSTYLNDRKGYKFTSSGETRFKLIENIYENAKKELQVLNDNFHFIVSSPEYFLNDDLTYKDILRNIRTEIIDITGRKDISFTGGNTSNVLVIGEGEQQRFFKGQDVLSDPDLDVEIFELDEQSLTDEEREKCKKKLQFDIGTIDAHINAGEELSKRNVATSRLAAVLGESGLVVKARNAIIMQGDQLPRSGVIMSKARGDKIDILKNYSNQIDLRRSKYRWLILQITPEAKRQFSMLQLLDLLAGQVDRHKGNYYLNYEIDENSIRGIPFLTVNILSIEGIDNDMAFGQISALDLMTKQQGKNMYGLNPGCFGILELPQLQEDLSRILPYIDKEFAEHILDLSKNPVMIDFIFRDLLSKAELNALKDRLAGIAETLRRYTGRLLSGGQWGEVDARVLFGINPNFNYMSRLMHDLVTNTSQLLK